MILARDHPDQLNYKATTIEKKDLTQKTQSNNLFLMEMEDGLNHISFEVAGKNDETQAE